MSTLLHDYKDDGRLTRHRAQCLVYSSCSRSYSSHLQHKENKQPFGANPFRILEPGLYSLESHSTDLRRDRSLGRGCQILPLLNALFSRRRARGAETAPKRRWIEVVNLNWNVPKNLWLTKDNKNKYEQMGFFIILAPKFTIKC